MGNFSYQSRMKWWKILLTIAGVIAVAFVLLILFSLFVVWGIGSAKGESEIRNMLVGSWVIDTDTLGKIQVEEIFDADGTWQRGNTEGIQRKGRWQYYDQQIEIQETKVTVGNVSEPINNKRVIEIVNLEYNEIVCKEGDRQFVLKRKAPPVIPKETTGHEN